MSDEEVLRSQNRSLCDALASMTARMHSADDAYQSAVKIAAEAESMLVGLLKETSPETMIVRGGRRTLIRVMERLQRIKRLK